MILLQNTIPESIFEFVIAVLGHAYVSGEVPSFSNQKYFSKSLINSILLKNIIFFLKMKVIYAHN